MNTDGGYRATTWAVCAALLLMTGLTSGEETKLRYAQLTSPGTVFSQGDFWNSEKTEAVFYDGIIVPNRRLTFTPASRQADIKLAGSIWSFHLRGDGEYTLQQGTQTFWLEETHMGFAPLRITLDGSRPCSLAFPRYFEYEDEGVLFWRSGCVMSGKLREEDVALYDDNADGVYDKTHDTILTGKLGAVSVFAPISKHLATSKGVFTIGNLSKEGGSLYYTPHKGPTESIQVLWDALEGGVSCMGAFQSRDGGTTFVARHGEQLTVPPGAYRLLYGLAYKEGEVVSVIVPGEGKSVELKQTQQTGGKKALVLGNLQLECDTRLKEDGVLIVDSITVRGCMGEQYLVKVGGVRVEIQSVADPKQKMSFPMTKTLLGGKSVYWVIAQFKQSWNSPYELFKGKCRVTLDVSTSLKDFNRKDWVKELEF